MEVAHFSMDLYGDPRLGPGLHHLPGRQAFRFSIGRRVRSTTALKQKPRFSRGSLSALVKSNYLRILPPLFSDFTSVESFDACSFRSPVTSLTVSRNSSFTE